MTWEYDQSADEAARRKNEQLEHPQSPERPSYVPETAQWNKYAEAWIDPKDGRAYNTE
jgi:hypothetical protein